MTDLAALVACAVFASGVLVTAAGGATDYLALTLAGFVMQIAATIAIWQPILKQARDDRRAG